MSKESDVFGRFIPHSVLCYLMSTFLSVEDICRFDSTICNKKKRSHFLECIGSESSIWNGEEEKVLSPAIISWLSARFMKIRYLRCSKIDQDTAVKISEIGSCLHSLHLDDKEFPCESAM